MSASIHMSIVASRTSQTQERTSMPATRVLTNLLITNDIEHERALLTDINQPRKALLSVLPFLLPLRRALVREPDDSCDAVPVARLEPQTY